MAGNFWRSFNSGYQTGRDIWERNAAAREREQAGLAYQAAYDSAPSQSTSDAVAYGDAAQIPDIPDEARGLYVKAAEDALQRGYGAPSDDLRMAAGYAGQQRYYAGIGNTEKAAELGLKSRQMRSMDTAERRAATQDARESELHPLNVQARQQELEAGKTQQKLHETQLAAAELKQKLTTARTKGLPGMLEFYDKEVGDGHTSQVQRGKDGSLSIFRVPADGSAPKLWQTFKPQFGLSAEQMASLVIDGHFGDDKTLLKIAELNMNNDLKRAIHAAKGAGGGAKEPRITPEQQTQLSELNRQYYATDDPKQQAAIGRKIMVLQNDIAIANNRFPSIGGLTREPRDEKPPMTFAEFAATYPLKNKSGKTIDEAPEKTMQRYRQFVSGNAPTSASDRALEAMSAGGADPFAKNPAKSGVKASSDGAPSVGSQSQSDAGIKTNNQPDAYSQAAASSPSILRPIVAGAALPFANAMDFLREPYSEHVKNPKPKLADSILEFGLGPGR